jgi:flavin-dependent dehydrogenase
VIFFKPVRKRGVFSLRSSDADALSRVFIMFEDADIAIVGAGPSGCIAACLLAGRFRVLLLERHHLPRAKSCSGVLVRKSVDLLERHIGRIPDAVLCTPQSTTGLTVVTTNRRFDFPDGGLNVTRSAFDCWLAREAHMRGARLVEGAVLTGLSSDGLGVVFRRDGKECSCRARLVVACDGVNGVCRRVSGLEPLRKVVTFQKYYDARIDMDPGRFYAFTSPDFSRYDAWLNSKDGAVVVGSIASSRVYAERYQGVFAKYLEGSMNLRIQRELHSEFWTLPLVKQGFVASLFHGGVFFCGEAAGLLNPFGEGMSIGMGSAVAMAEACADVGLADRVSLQESYKACMSEELAYMKRQWDYVRQLSPEFALNLTKLEAEIM